MKRIFFATAIFTVVSLLTGCSSDDDVVAGNGLTSKTYENNELAITYNGEVVIGKKVDFSPTNGKATLTFTGQEFDLGAITADLGGDMTLPNVATCGVFPGNPTYTLTVDLTGDENSCTFSGNAETDFCTFSYSGSVNSESLSIQLKDVTLKDVSIAGTWTLPALDDNAYNVLRMVWDSTKGVDMGMGFDMPMNSILGMLFVFPMQGGLNLVQLLEGSLKSITFGNDGNITVNYLATSGDNAGTYQDSPKNIAQYVVTGGKILVFLNPQGIAYADAMTKSRAADINAILGQILTQLAPMFATGVPLEFGKAINAEGDAIDESDLMSIYLGTDFLLPIFKAISPMCQDEEFVAMLTGLIASDPAMAGMAPMITGIINSLPAIIDTTSKIEIGVNLQK